MSHRAAEIAVALWNKRDQTLGPLNFLAKLTKKQAVTLKTLRSDMKQVSRRASVAQE